MRNEADAQGGSPAPSVDAQFWLDRIKDYQEKFGKWHDKCDNADKLYSRRGRSDMADREYAIFWANIEVLKPAVYARAPVPVVAPRFKDGNPIAREASDMLERAISVNFESCDIDGVLKSTRDSFLMYSRGTAWAVHDAENERVIYDVIDKRDFAHDMAKLWREVGWAARRAWLTRADGKARFADKFADVPLKKRDQNAVTPDKRDKAPVWEIWCKDSRKVYWVAEDHSEILDTQEPLFDLRGFFPCPQPAYGTLDPGSLLPVPEIVQYKDQIEEINEYTGRIAAVSETLRMKGFYASGSGDIGTAIETAMKSQDNRALLVPISSFAALGGQGLRDSIIWMPITDALQLVQGLVELRRVVIEDVYQITGISDIVRGQTEASETLGAQQLKSQWGSMRIRERQGELARFARDLTRITAEIMAEHFDIKTLVDMSQSRLPTAEQKMQAQAIMQQLEQAQQPAPPELVKLLKQSTIEDVNSFLKDDRTRGFVIEVETDSTIQPDEDAEKQRRIEFVTSVGGLFQQAAPLVMQAPMMGKFVVEVMKFAAAGFRAGRPLESALDELAVQVEAMAEKSAQPQEPQPDPAIEIKKAELQLRQQEAQAKIQMDGQRLEFDKQKTAAEIEISREKSDQEMALKRDQHAMEMQHKRETEQGRIADAKEGRASTLEASSRPAMTMNVDAQGAIGAVAEKLEGMAVEQSQAVQMAVAALQSNGENMTQVVEVLAQAVEKLGAPKRGRRMPDGSFQVETMVS